MSERSHVTFVSPTRPLRVFPGPVFLNTLGEAIERGWFNTGFGVAETGNVHPGKNDH